MRVPRVCPKKIVETSRQTRFEERLAQRRRDRVTDLGPGARRQLDAGFPVLYDVDGESVKEYPDGRRYVVRLIDGGQSDVHVRQI